MMFPIQVKREKIVFSSGAITIANNLVRFLQCNGEAGEVYGTVNSVESIVYVTYLVTRAGVVRNLVVKATLPPGVGQSFSYTVDVNQVPSAMNVILSGAAQVDGSDLVNSVAVVIGDRITIVVLTGALSNTTTHAVSIELETNMVREKRDYASFSSFSTTIAAGATMYLSSAFKYVSGGAPQAAEGDTRVNYLVVRKATLKNLVALASGMAGVGQSFVYTVRVNGAPTALTVTVSGGAQYTNYNSTIIVAVNPGDRITLEVVVSGAAAARAHACAFDLEEGDLRGES